MLGKEANMSGHFTSINVLEEFMVGYLVLSAIVKEHVIDSLCLRRAYCASGVADSWTNLILIWQNKQTNKQKQTKKPSINCYWSIKGSISVLSDELQKCSLKIFLSTEI